MWRIEVSEIGRSPLPPVDLDGDELVIGSGEGCSLRLPALSVQPQHLRLRKVSSSPLVIAWVAGHELALQGTSHGAGASGENSAPLLVELGGYRLSISQAPDGAVAAPPQRTESLARELLRSIMGGAAPRLVVEAGPAIGSSRILAPPDSRFTVGRGDEADWVILDEDLSRVHVALVRTWDGVRVVDLGSKNGTRVDGERVPPDAQGRPLRDGARLALGDVLLRFVDEAERYLTDDALAPASPERAAARSDGARAGQAPSGSAADSRSTHRGSSLVTGLGLLVAVLALAAAAYLLLGG